MPETIPNNYLATLQHKKYECLIGLLLGIFYLALYQYNIIISIWASLPLFLLGIPHGAIETQERIAHIPGLHYTFLYIIFGILVFCSWLLSPHYTLALFLILSAYHFGQSEKHYPLIGLWVVSGSMLLYPTETLSVFSYLTGENLNTRELLTAGRLIAGTVATLLMVQIAVK